MIQNVTPTHIDHICQAVDGLTGQVCGATSTKAHVELEKVIGPDGSIILVAVCADNPNHRECFNNRLTAAHEVESTRDEASREQIRNVRALHKYLGLPVQ